MNTAGRCVIHLYFSHSDAFEKFLRPSDEEITITRMLDKVIRRSDVVDKESLCILAGQRVRYPLSHILELGTHGAIRCGSFASHSISWLMPGIYWIALAWQGL
jgi:hypothetical protein